MQTDWTLFLDRDGVINKRIPGQYIQSWEAFEFLEGVLQAIPIFNQFFKKTVIVTNQQGIGKKLMTVAELDQVHQQMLEAIKKSGGNIDNIYYCPSLAAQNTPCRKPNTGMALDAQNDFPEIIFKKSVMIGDSISDMEFGLSLGMKTVFVTTKPEDFDKSLSLPIDYRYPNLLDFALYLQNNYEFFH